MNADALARLLHNMVMPGQEHPGGIDDPASEWPCREWAERVINFGWPDAVKAEAGRAAWVEGYCRSSDDFEHHINACANRECDCPSNPLAANPYGHDQGGTQ